MTSDKGHPRKKRVTMTSSTFRKDPTFPITGTKPHVTKPQYEVSYNPHTKRSCGEKCIQDNSHTKHLHVENIY